MVWGDARTIVVDDDGDMVLAHRWCDDTSGAGMTIAFMAPVGISQAVMVRAAFMIGVGQVIGPD